MSRRVDWRLRFWDKVMKTESCWLWTASSRNKRGYGQLAVHRGDRRRPELAHRLSWELAYGAPPENLFVLHKCDNPKCVRPEHLFLGTHQDNMLDMNRKGRGDRSGLEAGRSFPPPVRLGEAHGRAKLTVGDVVAIRTARAKGEKLSTIAARYGIHEATVSAIVLRKVWRHVA